MSSSVSVKSDRSKSGEPPDFSEKTKSSTKRYFMGFFLLVEKIHIICAHTKTFGTQNLFK